MKTTLNAIRKLTEMTNEQIDHLFELSKDDKAIIVGSEIRQLCAQAKLTNALEKDAERYRWLRLASLSKGDHDYYAKVDRWSVSVENSGFGHSFHADALDAAIDAALAIKEQK